MLKTIRTNAFDAKSSISTLHNLPPTFLLPFLSRSFNSTAQIISTPIDNLDISKEAPPTSKIVSASPQASSPSNTTDTITTSIPPPPPTTTPPPRTRRSVPLPPDPSTLPPQTPLSSSLRKLLPLLLAQPSHFITAHIHSKPYLLTQGDTVRLPFRMPGVVPGDILRLNRATAIGSRDYTLKGSSGPEGYLDERIFECRAVVVGNEGEPVRVKEKTKRRNRRVRTVRSKLKFTVLRVGELRVKTLKEIEGGVSA